MYYRKLIDIIVVVSLATLAGAIFAVRQNNARISESRNAGLAATSNISATDAPSTRVAELKYLWVQMMPDEGTSRGGRLVRAIVTEGKDCPTVVQDGQTLPMNPHAPAVRAAFPILLCEVVLVKDSEARIGSRVLPARPIEPNNIVVIGDTGCRMVHWQAQSCRTGEDWPFAQIASHAADQASGKEAQSLILHLGDLHYREHQCADASFLCGGSPFGDNWETWEKEFFEPAKKLLLAAPWIIMRGNHEECDRAGAGWLFFFALPGHHTSSNACDNDLRNYNVSMGKTDDMRPRILLVMDTSCEKNKYGIRERCKQYAESLTPPEQKDSELWLALHQPLWLRRPNGKLDKPDSASALGCGDGDKDKLESAVVGIRAKFEATPSERLARVVLSGDIHVFQFFWPKTASTPIQIIAGNGGTALDPLFEIPQSEWQNQQEDDKCDGKSRASQDKDKSKVKAQKMKQEPALNLKSYGIEGSSVTFAQHGFTVMRREGSAWTATQFDRDANEVVACQFSEALSPGPSDPAPHCGSFRKP
jgi:hypothetical protein